MGEHLIRFSNVVDANIQGQQGLQSPTFSTINKKKHCGSFNFRDKEYKCNFTPEGEMINMRTVGNEIWYESIDNSVIWPVKCINDDESDYIYYGIGEGYDDFGANITSNTCVNGKGIITFDGEITKSGKWGDIEGFNISTQATLNLKKIIFPNTVEVILEYAFYVCNNLSSVELPDSVAVLETYCFCECVSLGQLTIPASVRMVGDYFASRGIKELTFKSINPPVIEETLDLSNVIINVPSVSLGKYRKYFEGYSISSCIFKPFEQPNNEIWYTSRENTIIKPIQRSGFGRSLTFRELEIGEGESDFGAKILYYGNGVIVFDGPVTKMGNFANGIKSTIPPRYPFATMYLTSIYFPSTVTEIYGSTFVDCNALEYVKLNEGLLSIPYNCFAGCIHLTDLEIPSTLSEVNSTAFDNCSNLETIYFNRIYAPGISGDTALFSGCTNLENIFIPTDRYINYEQAWEEEWFFDKVAEVIPDNEIWYTTMNNQLAQIRIGWDYDEYCWIYGDVGDAVPSLHNLTISAHTVENGTCKLKMSGPITGLTSIYNDDWGEDVCFLGDNVTISKLKLNNNIANVSSSAFHYLSASKIILSKNLKEITNAFYNSSITGLSIPHNVIKINSWAFKSCSSLRSLYIPDSVTSVGGSAFYDCYAMLSLKLPDSLDSLGSGTFDYCGSLSSITMPTYLREIPSSCFNEEATIISAITISKYLKSFGQNYLPYLQHIYGAHKGISSDRKCFGIYDELKLFARAGLTSYEIPSKYTSIGKEVFIYCGSLTSITIPNSVTYIRNYAFYECNSLTGITIPNSVTYIGDYAFCNCESLTSINIPNSVTSIGSNAFKYCGGLRAVNCYSTTPPSLGGSAFDGNDAERLIVVPHASLSDYKGTTGWKTYANSIVSSYLPQTWKTLSITADDVNGIKTKTTVHYTYNTDGYDSFTSQQVSDVLITGNDVSHTFPQNTSTTQTVQRTITYSGHNLTASTVITQGVWVDQNWEVDLLDGQWGLGDNNPEPTTYIQYRSLSNYNVNNGYATMKITFEGYDTFTIYINSYAESNYDYTIAWDMDKAAPTSNPSSSSSGVKSHTNGFQYDPSGSVSSNYKAVSYPNDGGEHFVCITYRKDGSVNANYDRGYLLIPN